MSSVAAFTFNAIDLYVVTLDGKPWTRAKGVCKALEHQKGRARVILKKKFSNKSNSLAKKT